MEVTTMKRAKLFRFCIAVACVALVAAAASLLYAKEEKVPDIVYYPLIGYPFLYPVPLVSSPESPTDPSSGFSPNSVTQPIVIYRPSGRD